MPDAVMLVWATLIPANEKVIQAKSEQVRRFKMASPMQVDWALVEISINPCRNTNL